MVVYSIQTAGGWRKGSRVIPCPIINNPCNSIAPGWATQVVGGGNERMVNSCTITVSRQSKRISFVIRAKPGARARAYVRM